MAQPEKMTLHDLSLNFQWSMSFHMIAHDDMITETFNSRRIPWLGWLHSGGLTRQYCPLQHCPYRKSLVGDHHHQHPPLSLVHKFLSHYLTKAPSPQMTFMSVTFMNASVPFEHWSNSLLLESNKCWWSCKRSDSLADQGFVPASNRERSLRTEALSLPTKRGDLTLDQFWSLNCKK